MEQNNFEHIIRKKFEGYAPQPPAHVWESIRHEAVTGNQKDIVPLYRRKQVVITVIAGLAAAAILLFFLMKSPHSSSTSKDALPGNNVIAKDSSDDKYAKPGKNDSDVDDNTKPVLTDEERANPNPADTNKRGDSTNQQNNNGKGNSSPHKQKKDEQQPGGLPADKNTLLREMNNAEALAMLQPLKPSSKLSSRTIDKRHSAMHSQKEDEQTPDLALHVTGKGNNNWSFGLYATPEIMMNNAPASNKHSNYSADFAVIFSTGKFSIQSGLSYLRGNNNENVNINYLKYKYLGSYEDVYNVTFDSTANGTVTPTYHTKTVDVYDTLQKNTTSRFENNYKYLNLPVLMGYQGTINEKLSYNLKGGPIISFMLEDNRKLMFNQPNADIMQANTPEDLAGTNWQALISAGFQYQIRNNIHLAVEPRLKYYFNPIYNVRNNYSREKAYSLGIRTGLVFDF